MKSTVIHLRASEAERLVFEESAKRAGFKLCAWLRLAANEYACRKTLNPSVSAKPLTVSHEVYDKMTYGAEPSKPLNKASDKPFVCRLKDI